MLDRKTKNEMREKWENSEDKASENFEKIKKSIKGLYEIMKINLAQDDIYYQMGIDNILGLYHNFLDIMLNEKGANDLMRKLKDSKLEVDIVLNGVVAGKDYK